MQNNNQPVGWMVEISGADKFFCTKKSAENARRRYEKTFDAERMEPYALFTSPPAPVADDMVRLLTRARIYARGEFRDEIDACLAGKTAPVVVVQQCKIGIYGKAYDAPETKRAYTYTEQPDNVGASKLGKACVTAYHQQAGDSIDRGLSLLKSLAAEGFGVFEIDKVKELNQ